MRWIMPGSTDKGFNDAKGYSSIAQVEVGLMLSLKDLVEAGLHSEGEKLIWNQLGRVHSGSRLQ